MANKRLLIVEDETNLAITLAQALHITSKGDYHIEICDSGDKALTLLRDKHFDLVISDLRLPGVSGLEVITNIRERNQSTRTILMTGYGSEEVEAQAAQITDAYMTKPFDIPDMLRVVNHILISENGGNNIAEIARSGRILIMEDDPGLQRIYEKALGSAGYEIFQTTSIQKTRELLEQYEFDVFICDIHLGRERGTDLVMEQREKLTQNGTHIIMVSAYGQYRSVTEELGADFFMEKPISLGTLITLIGKLVENSPANIPA